MSRRPFRVSGDFRGIGAALRESALTGDSGRAGTLGAFMAAMVHLRAEVRGVVFEF